jgi:hypothetical protein
MIIYLLINVDDKSIMFKSFMFWFYITMNKIYLNFFSLFEHDSFFIWPTSMTNLSWSLFMLLFYWGLILFLPNDDLELYPHIFGEFI